MQEPEIDNGSPDSVSAEGETDGLSQLLPPDGAGDDAEPEIDPEFLKARSQLEQAWADHAVCDLRAAAAGFATRDEGRAAMAEMDRIQHRIRDIETALVARLAGNLAELRIKIAMLSIDGQLRPEFEPAVLDDAMRLLTAREKG